MRDINADTTTVRRVLSRAKTVMPSHGVGVGGWRLRRTSRRVGRGALPDDARYRAETQGVARFQCVATPLADRADPGVDRALPSTRPRRRTPPGALGGDDHMGNDRIDDPTTGPRTRTTPVAVDPRGVTLSKHFLSLVNAGKIISCAFDVLRHADPPTVTGSNTGPSFEPSSTSSSSTTSVASSGSRRSWLGRSGWCSTELSAFPSRVGCGSPHTGGQAPDLADRGPIRLRSWRCH